MKKIKKAFTLIELLVVTTIIALISGSWVFYFLDFVKQQEVSQKLVIIKDDLESLDKQVKNYDIFDYELQFSTSNTGSLLYRTYVNNFDSDNQTIEITSIDTWSWKITTIWSPTWTGIIKIYKNHKLFLNKEIARNTTFEFNFKETPNYKITWTNSWKILNEINLKYFSEENLYPERNDLLELIEMNTAENKSWTWYTDLIIKNIWWKKTIWSNENEIYLFFENNWIENFIKITK